MRLEDTDSIIRQAEEYAAEVISETADDGTVVRRARGWSTARHYDAPTTDIPVHAIPGVLELFNKCAMSTLGPMLRALVGNKVSDEDMYIYINDAFIVKYEVASDGALAPSQRFLPIHADQSHYSFTIALNSADEYDDGGTYFVDLNRSLKVDKGHCLMFPGSLRHGGDPITRGVRYILAVFAFVSSSGGDQFKSGESSLFGKGVALSRSSEPIFDSNEKANNDSFSFKRARTEDSNTAANDNGDFVANISSSSNSFSFGFSNFED